jgi:iron complex transport system ATP-binding protein
LIELRGVRVELGGTPVLHGISFSVARGEWVGLLGPNGAGKTTALRALAGLVAYHGDVVVDGSDARALGRRELARVIAVVPQLPERPPELTVAEYVLLGRTPHLGYFAGESTADRAAAAAALERLELTAFAERRLGSLSGGEVQRAVLARALAQEAPVLLLDEPTAAMDIGHQQEVLELVEQLRRESRLTVIATMHDLTLAAQYGDRIVLLDRGRVIASGASDEVLSRDRVLSLYGASVRLVWDDEKLVAVVPVRPRPAG